VPDSNAEARPSLLRRTWLALEPTAGLSGEEAAAYDWQRVRYLHNWMRVRFLMGLFGHVGAALYFNALPRASVSSAQWLDTLVWLHSIAAGVVAFVLLAINISTKKLRASRWRTALFESILRFSRTGFSCRRSSTCLACRSRSGCSPTDPSPRRWSRTSGAQY
jgi:hypothetical protein